MIFIRWVVILIIGRRKTSKNHKIVHEPYLRRQKVQKTSPKMHTFVVVNLPSLPHKTWAFSYFTALIKSGSEKQSSIFVHRTRHTFSHTCPFYYVGKFYDIKLDKKINFSGTSLIGKKQNQVLLTLKRVNMAIFSIGVLLTPKGDVLSNILKLLPTQ